MLATDAMQAWLDDQESSGENGGMIRFYFLAQGEEVTGPFSSRELLDAWRRGQIQRDAKICDKEIGDEWMELRYSIADLENECGITRTAVMATAAAGTYQTTTGQRKNELATFILNFLFPGLGHVYLEKYLKALVIFLVVIPAVVIAGVLGFLFVSVASAVIGMNDARRIQ